MALNSFDVISFNVTRNITGANNASIVLSNDQLKFSPGTSDFLGRLIQLTVNGSVVMTGRVKDVSAGFSPDGMKIATMRLASITENLNRRAVSTERYASQPGEDLIKDVLTLYGGLKPAFVGTIVDNSEVFDGIVVQGNSVTTEVRKIAEACQCECFSNANGQIVTELKKDETSPVEVTIDKEDIEDDINESTEEGLTDSVCRVRGKYINAYESSTDDPLVSSTTIKVMPRTEKQAFVIIPFKRAVTRLQALSTVIPVVSGADSATVVGVQRDGILVRFDYVGEDSDGGGGDGPRFEAGELNEVIVGSLASFLGNPDKEVEQAAIAAAEAMIIGQNKNFSRKGLNRRIVPGGKGSKYDRSNLDEQASTLNESKTMNRVEAVAKHQPSIDQFGVRERVIDNVYIQDETVAEEIGIRSLYEERISQNPVQFKTAFSSTLNKVNLVVSVPISDTGDVAKCLVVSLSISYDASNGRASTTYTCLRLEE